MSRYILLASLVLLFAACKKDKPEPDMRPRWHVDNRYGYEADLNYRFYRNMEDYANGTDAFISIRLPWGSDTGVAMDQDILDNGYFYLDVYSDDFITTNWGQSIVRIPTAYLFENTLTNTLFGIRPTTVRSRYISGNKTQQIWQAVGAFDLNAQNVWDTMSANNRYKKVTLRKDMRFVMEQKDAAGNVVTDSGSFDTKEALSYMPALFTYTALRVSDDVSVGSIYECNEKGEKFTGPDSATIMMNGVIYLIVR